MPLNPWKDFGTKSDFYPFGSPMDGRTFGSEKYRFGFNTQEKVDEVYGKGNLNTALFWEYDTRLGRRWNLDPKPQINISDYAVMGNNPIANVDLLGDSTIYYSDSGKLLFVSQDGLENALVIIREEDVDMFLAIGAVYQHYGQQNTDNANIRGRMYGTEYVISDFFQYFHDIKEGEEYVDEKNNKTGWRREKGSVLFDVGGRMKIDSKVAFGNFSRIDFKEDYGEMPVESKSKIHTHPNIGKTFESTFSSGISPFDSKTHNTPSQYMDAAIESDVLFFYNEKSAIRVDSESFKNK